MSQDLTTMAVNGALPVSTRERERFVPPHYLIDGDAPASAPVYLLGALTDPEKRTVMRSAVGTAGDSVSTRELREALREGAIAELDPEEAAQVCAALDQLEALEGAPESNRDEDMEEALASLQKQLSRWQTRISHLHKPLRELLQMQLDYYDALAVLTVRACIRGWENLPAPCRRKGIFVTPEAMLAIPDRDFEALTERCSWLRELTKRQEPGSASP